MARENGGSAAAIERHNNGWVLEQGRLALLWVLYYYVIFFMYPQIQGGSPSLGINIFGLLTLNNDLFISNRHKCLRNEIM